MVRKGDNIYVPVIVIEEIEDIMKQEDITVKSVAAKKMADYSRMGREIDRMMKFDFGFKKKKIKKQEDIFR